MAISEGRSAWGCLPGRCLSRGYLPGALQVNMAVSTNASRRQWIDLDIHTEACMTRMTRGADGGAISVWIRASNCTG